MFKKLLIANRGEIACRIVKTAHKMGLKTVGVYSEIDAFSLHSTLCDQSYLIGPPQPALSYLVVDHYMEAINRSHAQAVHPGYGFLSENAEFVDLLEKKKVIFVGPPSSAIRAMGSKAESKRIMEKAKVPIVPGYHGVQNDDAHLKAQAKIVGYPVMLKASMGGGGKGMRIVESEAEFDEKL